MTNRTEDNKTLDFLLTKQAGTQKHTKEFDNPKAEPWAIDWPISARVTPEESSGQGCQPFTEVLTPV